MSRPDAEDVNAAPGESRARHFASAAFPPEFYARPADVVARELLGARIVSRIGGERSAGEIVETEAYVGPADEASHAHERFGVTPRNRVMFGAPGIAYVYLIYGMHWCLNAVTGAEGHPAAVLLRAARPVEGLDVISARRPGRGERDLLRGPGNLARGLGVDGALNGHSLSATPLWIEHATGAAPVAVLAGPRVGISRATEAPLRFSIADSPYVSRG